jgi:two-component system, NtrC family, sensor histidine kinase HydH
MLSTTLVPDQSYLDSLKAYVGFTDQSSAALREMLPVIRLHIERIIDDFYATIEAHPGARAAITGGAEQIARLKRTLRRWLEELFQGPHDQAYLERRARIGRMHVRIDLPQAYMFTAMNRIRVQCAAVIREHLNDNAQRATETLTALDQIMDIELAIMLETYREDLMIRNRGAERLATIGHFAAGIGHELRNPLSVVESSVFLLRQRLSQSPMDPKVERHLVKIENEVKRCNQTITDLLELARNRPPKPRATLLPAMLTAAVAAANLPAGIVVHTSSPADVEAMLDEDQVIRVLTNLLINAGQAMQGHGQIWLESQRSPGRTLFRVRDEGPGVPPDLRHRLFQALFTTKAKGTGIGLALCRRIVESHGGNIVLEPTETGASFLVTIPDVPIEGRQS